MNHIIPKLLRLLDKKNVDYYLISSSDEFLNEYVSEQDKRLKWITNFLLPLLLADNFFKVINNSGFL